MKWEPIETAPKDGSRILVFGPMEDGDELRPDPPCTDVGMWDDFDHKWMVENVSALGTYCRATHWMPLPPPPEPQP